ncbi:MAG: peptidylprolyl isomerase [Oscillospiraceae bacterium]|nr:peptidylprolyl isomerase [Oscillospiraceae bacterium]
MLLATVLGGCGEKKNPVATISIVDYGDIVVELYPDKAPNTVSNFISLANEGYYSGKVFHRAVSGFMIQGGSPNGDGSSSGFPYAIAGEFSANGFAQNDIVHEAGVISMARLSGKNDSASCQFFIMHGAANHLDGQYAAFGKVLSGMEIVDQIATAPVNGDALVNQPVIKSVTVDTHGEKYAAPVTLAPVQ